MITKKKLMRILANILLWFFVLVSLIVAYNVMAGDLPDPALTPGVLADTRIEILCSSKTNLTRNVPASLKEKVFSGYGLKQEHRPDCTGPGHSCYEGDHLFPRKLGGADALANIWPQRYDGTLWNAHVKDRLEDRLIHKVCVDKTMTQLEAFYCITSDWIRCYRRTFETN